MAILQKHKQEKSPIAATVRLSPIPADKLHNLYDMLETENKLPSFTPNCEPGIHLPFMLNRNSMTKAFDFFSLYFTNKLIETISKHTNSFALTVIDKKQYYAYEDCTWKETTPDAIKKLIALFLYQGLVS